MLKYLVFSQTCCVCVCVCVSGAKIDTSDTVDVLNIAVCELSGHLPIYR